MFTAKDVEWGLTYSMLPSACDEQPINLSFNPFILVHLLISAWAIDLVMRIGVSKSQSLARQIQNFELKINKNFNFFFNWKLWIGRANDQPLNPPILIPIYPEYLSSCCFASLVYPCLVIWDPLIQIACHQL